ncbi:hypothetical protein ABZ746_17105 [Streptomyces sp. NPDC020096]
MRGIRPRAITGKRQTISAILPVTLPTDPPWPQGPLPFSHADRRADTATRSTYFTPAAARVLYGTPHHPNRWYRTTAASSGPLTVQGVELLRTATTDDPDHALAIIHMSVTGPALLDTLRSLARRRHATHTPLTGPLSPEILLQGHATLAPAAAPYTVTLLTTSRRALPALHKGRDHRRWPTIEQWLWDLASRTNATDFPPDIKTTPTITAKATRISADWSALVLRDGAAFINHRPDQGPADPFYGFAELHTRTVYLDALLLGMIQRDHIDQLTEELADAFDHPRLAHRLATLERRIAHFRSTYWRQHLTAHSTANDLLTAYQAQHRMPERFQEILAEAADYNRIAQAQDSQQIGGALGILTILGLPVSTALSALQVLGDQNAWHLATATAAALAATAGLLTTRYGRLVIDALRN